MMSTTAVVTWMIKLMIELTDNAFQKFEQQLEFFIDEQKAELKNCIKNKTKSKVDEKALKAPRVATMLLVEVTYRAIDRKAYKWSEIYKSHTSYYMN